MTFNLGGPIDSARHLPGSVYSSPEIYAEEKQKIWMKDWLCIARSEEIENPGDYMAFRIAGEPVLVARNRAGELHAFSNVCAHRGAEVASGKGNVYRFSCPYHGWSYDLDGRLTGAAFMSESDFDQKTCRLAPIRLGLWGGWVFITFDDRAESLEAFLSEVEKEFGFLRQEDCRLAAKWEVELDCNWKLTVENFVDIYHIKVLHAKTFGKHRGDQADYPFNLKRRGGFSAFHASGPMTPDGRTLFRKMDVIADKPDNYAGSCHMAPNFHMFVRSDNVHHLIAWPMSPEKTRFIVYILFPKEFAADPEYASKVQVYTDFFNSSLVEDKAMVGSLQRAMGSQRFRPGPFSRLEKAVYNSINYYTERMWGSRQGKA